MLSRQQSVASANGWDTLSQGTTSSHASTLSCEIRDVFEEIEVENDLDGTETETETETEEASYGIEEAKVKIQRTISEVSTVVSGANKSAELQRALSEVSTVVSAADEVAKLQRTLSEVTAATSDSLFEDSQVFEEKLEALRRQKAAIDQLKAAVEMKIRKVSKNLRRLKRSQPPQNQPHPPPGIGIGPEETWIDTPETRHIIGTTELPTNCHRNGWDIKDILTTNITQEDLGETFTPRG